MRVRLRPMLGELFRCSGVTVLPEWLDPQVFLADPAWGPWVVLLVCAIVFAETGLLVGFFLPGDSLLFTAGLLVATGTVDVNVWVLGLLISSAAFAGDQLGYWIGRKAGPTVFSRPDSRIFRRENVERAEQFFARHGGKAVILARFVGVVRTFTPVVAGIGRMPYRVYVFYDAIGALLWGTGLTVLGYVLGNRVPFVRDHLDLLVVAVVLLTFATVGLGLLRQRRQTDVGPEDGPQVPEKPESASDVDAHAGSETHADSETYASSDAETDSETGNQADAETHADPSAAAETQSEANPKADGAHEKSSEDAEKDPARFDPVTPEPPAARRVPPRRAPDRPAAARQPERRLSPPRRPPLPPTSPLLPLKKPAPETGDGLL
ncbi:membrane protein DedA with SNARE-associated domain [Arthrobacter sp. UYP6]|uniref:DedA family protein n=1 Tax=Arthrobacter sp. UYP6 TaxID=1756378 RepID=UPI003392E3F2